jgi:hypothetical protein
MQRYQTGQLSGIPSNVASTDFQSIVMQHPILASHPYFNQDFVT